VEWLTHGVSLNTSVFKFGSSFSPGDGANPELKELTDVGVACMAGMDDWGVGNLSAVLPLWQKFT
jgi:hypothetical protein